MLIYQPRSFNVQVLSPVVSEGSIYRKFTDGISQSIASFDVFLVWVHCSLVTFTFHL